MLTGLLGHILLPAALSCFNDRLRVPFVVPGCRAGSWSLEAEVKQCGSTGPSLPQFGKSQRHSLFHHSHHSYLTEPAVKMFDFGKDDGIASKCYLTHATLPKYVDQRQPPTSKKPFSTILGQAFTHTVLATMKMKNLCQVD